MGDAWTLIVKAMLEYGAFGLLTMAGWGISAYFLYRDLKKKEEVSIAVKEKDKVIDTKDKEIKELNEARVTELKEMNTEYNESITDVNHTLDKLTVALHVRTNND